MPARHPSVTREAGGPSHYFWLQARNRYIHDEASGEFVRHVTDSAFRNEDAPMIEAQQLAMGSVSDLLSLQPILLAIDSGPVLARRMLAELIEREADPSCNTHV